VPLERTDEADVALGLEVEIEIVEELDVLAGASCLSSASSTRSDGLIKIMERHALATRQLARASFCSAR